MGDAGLEKMQKAPKKTRAVGESGAQSGAVGADLAPEPTRVVEAWHGLTPDTRRKIMALIDGRVDGSN
jgi:hypothetical protein